MSQLREHGTEDVREVKAAFMEGTAISAPSRRTKNSNPTERKTRYRPGRY